MKKTCKLLGLQIIVNLNIIVCSLFWPALTKSSLAKWGRLINKVSYYIGV